MLSDTHLSDLMTVLLETPDVDQFDPSSAVKHWNNAGPRARRPNIITDIGDIDDDSDESEMDEDAVTLPGDIVEDSRVESCGR